MTGTANAPPIDRVALVTGAGSGIGRAASLRLAQRGDAIGVFDLSADGAAETVALVEAAGGHALALPGDVSSANDLARAVATLADTYGPLTTAVANAGIEMLGTVLETSEADWQRAISVMLT